MRKIIPIILAGGTGTRLWPLSRESFPKQFLKLTDEDDFTLLQKTYKRIEDIENLSKPIIICNEELSFIVEQFYYFKCTVIDLNIGLLLTALQR